MPLGVTSSGCGTSLRGAQVQGQPPLQVAEGLLISAIYPGLAYDPVQDRIVGWAGGNTVYILNPSTGVWSTQTYAGAPAVLSNGTHGRFRYSPTSNVFVVCNYYFDSDCYTLRLTSGSGTPPPASSFDFALSNGASISATQGQSTSNAISATLVSGTTQTVGFSVSGLPSGATGTFTQSSCAPNCSTTLNISTLSTTPTGNYTVNVTSVAGSLTKSTAFTLSVNTPTTVSSGATDFQNRCNAAGVVRCLL